MAKIIITKLLLLHLGNFEKKKQKNETNSLY